MSLHGHLFTEFLVSMLRNDLLYAIATMSEFRGMGIYDVIVLACWKLPPLIWELVIRLQQGRADPYPDLRIGSRGLCIGRDPEQHL